MLPSAKSTHFANVSSDDWQSVITFCNNGIQEGDYVFTGRTSDIQFLSFHLKAVLLQVC